MNSAWPNIISAELFNGTISDYIIIEKLGCGSEGMWKQDSKGKKNKKRKSERTGCFEIKRSMWKWIVVFN